MMFSILVWVKGMATTALVDQARQEAVPVVNRRDPRATRRAPRLTRRRAREAPVDPPGRAGSWSRRHFPVRFCRRGCGRARAFRHFLCGQWSLEFGLAGLELAHAVAGEFDPVGVMDDAIEDGVGKRRVADDLVPALDWKLAGDDDRAGVIAILDNFQEIAALLGIELLRSPVVEDEKIDACKRAQELGVAAIATGEREGCEQPWHAVIEDGEVLAAGLVAERAGEPALANAARAGD